ADASAGLARVPSVRGRRPDRPHHQGGESRRMKRNSILVPIAALCTGLGALLSAAVAGAAPLPEEGIGLPRDVSAEGHRIDWLIKATGFFTSVLFVIMCVWMLWACLKHDTKHAAEYDHGNAKHQIRFAAILSAAIFFVVDGNLWVNSTIDINQVYWNFDKAEGGPNAVRIEINAHQWAWDARYAGPDGKF